ncbi:calcium-translocating P-type ATPase, SERCA-type [Lederbergia sp. NSJ-179]|uniref:calcium-translocating P-type ATPase, SERCA-type n=1 Tax=Lederbergia sp. NSJ-179 TaxID=2931402 RepID=UPI001FD4725B|nr:calcium-translocating P-type ATPase, SERCA-type [Lederbergia sp. NSJ-179]MCJ7839587.1 calcium-translocating P-type ATPase, SERCA-type [Lederbergia sp. NSJ-179]
MQFYEMQESEVEESLNTSVSQGLSDKAVETRRKKFGWNEISEGEKQSAILLFFSQFKDFMVVVLLGATLISGILGEYIDAITIMAIVFLNGILGFVQERKAEKSLEALRNLSAPQVSVLRAGQWLKINSREVVPGDILRFSSGDRLGADLRLIQANNLEIEESALTGESIPSTKHTGVIQDSSPNLGDLNNMAFKGTLVTSGNGMGIVTATGMKTAMGEIAHMIQTATVMTTPLQRRLQQLGKILIAVALALTLLVVIVGILHGHDVFTMFLAGVSLAVAAIPEGLPAIVTVALSLGVQRMIRKKAIVRKLPAVETLGCASVICSDKTGTMTQNKMTVTRIWSGGKTFQLEGEAHDQFYDNGKKINPKNEKSIKQLLTFGVLCNHADLMMKEGELVVDGDPTEGALLTAALKAEIHRESLLKQFTIEKEYPFDSARKMMSVIVRDENGKKFVITKGAPDVLAEKCESILWNQKKKWLNEELSEQIRSSVQRLSEQALRTIAIAFKPYQGTHYPQEESEIEKDLTFIGLQGMMDPPRPEVKAAVAECKQAGIKTVMITGDHKATACAIAEKLGILGKDDQVMVGQSLNKLSVDELEDVVEDVAVFARVTPEHKLKIVKALQNRGHIVAMTGDGINDAPAIKAADIGIAMGITGTDVAKEASSLILMDDNFTTIKSAIHEGRNIYENIRKFIRYLLASNVGEILVMLFAMLMSMPLPLVPIQILWVNLVTDGLPAMALGLDQPEDNVMKKKPRPVNEGVFARGLGWKIISRGFLIGISTLIAFMIIYQRDPSNLDYAQTVAFTTLILAQLIHVFDCRSEVSVFSRNPFENKYLVWSVLSSLALTFCVIYIPTLQPIFHTVTIEATDWLLITGMSALPTFLLAGSFILRKKK